MPPSASAFDGRRLNSHDLPFVEWLRCILAYKPVLQTDGRPVAHFDLIFIWATKYDWTVDQLVNHVIITVCDLLSEVKIT